MQRRYPKHATPRWCYKYTHIWHMQQRASTSLLSHTSQSRCLSFAHRGLSTCKSARVVSSTSNTTRSQKEGCRLNKAHGRQQPKQIHTVFPDPLQTMSAATASGCCTLSIASPQPVVLFNAKYYTPKDKSNRLPCCKKCAGQAAPSTLASSGPGSKNESCEVAWHIVHKPGRRAGA